MVTLDPSDSPLMAFLDTLPKQDDQKYHGWLEDDLTPLTDRDRAVHINLMDLYGTRAGHRLWLNWLDAGSPEHYTVIERREETP